MLVQLVQNEPEREDAFDRVDRQIARQAFSTPNSLPGSIKPNSPHET